MARDTQTNSKQPTPPEEAPAAAPRAAEKPAAPAAAKPAPRAAAPRPLIYLGPNLAALGLFAGQAFRGGRTPAHLAKARQEDPDLDALFVPVSGLAAARDDLKNPTTNLTAAYARVLARLQQARKEK
ncbi:MAG: hypothetical protein KQJ78_14770 [Deltaproteobacteria bacterium]|nr:hypothetical protein [Deltaproteobacteria bacterium]